MPWPVSMFYPRFCVLATSLHICGVKEVGTNTGISWAGVAHALNYAGLGAVFKMVLYAMVPHTSPLVGWIARELGPAGQLTCVLQG